MLIEERAAAVGGRINREGSMMPTSVSDQGMEASE
jgi:hypothetical protein